MICTACGNQWKLERAHILVTERTPEGCREIVKCPACGHESTATKPDLDACTDD